MVTFFLIGAALGAVTGIPIGPVNVAVIDSAYRHNLRRAVAVAAGGAIADCLYALLGIVGVGPLLVKHPIIPPILYAISGIVLVVYGVLTVRAQPVDPAKNDEQPATTESRRLWSGFLLGVILICLNPAALITWVVIVGSQFAGAHSYEGVVAALGVGVGSFAWFALVAWLADHGKRMLGEKAIWITRIVGIGLIGFGLFSIGRGVYIFATKL
jgi:threonine/homoserine/homoserine lactone efflux protein